MHAKRVLLADNSSTTGVAMICSQWLIKRRWNFAAMRNLQMDSVRAIAAKVGKSADRDGFPAQFSGLEQ